MSRNKLPFTCFTTGLLITLCGLTSAVAILTFTSIQSEVEHTFGKAHPSLSLPQRLWFQTILFTKGEELSTPLNPLAPPQPFYIAPNEPTHTILARLFQENIISDPETMRILLQYRGYDTQIQSGEHLLSPAMSPQQIAQALVDPHNLIIEFHLLAGWRNEEIATALVASGVNITAAEFLEATQQPLVLFFPNRSFPAEIRALQGFLLPATYRIQKTATAFDLIHLFTNNFDAQITAEIEHKFQQQGLSLYEGIILASIVQRESILEEEMPLIASVFLNRLRVQMKLDSDATVQYALGFNQKQNTWWTNPLSSTDLTIDSPYNTYLYSGLPPTPICNPSLAAIYAVAEAPQSNYFFFRATCDGSGRHLFAETFPEHLENACP